VSARPGGDGLIRVFGLAIAGLVSEAALDEAENINTWITGQRGQRHAWRSEHTCRLVMRGGAVKSRLEGSLGLDFSLAWDEKGNTGLAVYAGSSCFACWLARDVEPVICMLSEVTRSVVFRICSLTIAQDVSFSDRVASF
jgi:hypothetical protein